MAASDAGPTGGGRWRRQGVALLAAGGLFVALYLLGYKLGIYGSMTCTAGGACRTVQTSSYSTLMGVPVAGWGALWYVGVLAATLWRLHAPPSRKAPSRALLILAGGGLVAAAVLVGIQLWVLEAICPWCMASEAVVALIALLVGPEYRSA